MTNEERMKKGYLWLDTGESMDLQIHQRSLIYDFNHTRPDDLERRQELLKQIFGHLGEGVWVEPPLSASFGCTDTIGDRTYINSNLNLVDDLGITIGSDVLIAPNHGMDYCDTDITMKEILPVFSAAKELGIKEFGACYTFDSVPELKKTRILKTKSFHLEF